MSRVGQIEKRTQQRVVRLFREQLGYDYHELAHLIEPRHNDRFVALMDRHLPRWRHHRKVLNEARLGHADWNF